MSQASKEISELVRARTHALQAELEDTEEAVELYRWKIKMGRRSGHQEAGKFADFLETTCLPDLEAREARLRKELADHITAGRDAMQEVAELEAQGLVC